MDHQLWGHLLWKLEYLNLVLPLGIPLSVRSGNFVSFYHRRERGTGLSPCFFAHFLEKGFFDYIRQGHPSSWGTGQQSKYHSRFDT